MRVEHKRRTKAKTDAKPKPQPPLNHNVANKQKQKLAKTVTPQAAVQKTVKDARLLAEAGRATQALQTLADAFAGLDEAPGIDPWEPDRLLEWANEQPEDVEHAARFVLSLEDRDGVEFPLHDALEAWNDLDRAAFLTWLMKPWWA